MNNWINCWIEQCRRMVFERWRSATNDRFVLLFLISSLHVYHAIQGFLRRSQFVRTWRAVAVMMTSVR